MDEVNTGAGGKYRCMGKIQTHGVNTGAWSKYMCIGKFRFMSNIWVHGVTNGVVIH